MNDKLPTPWEQSTREVVGNIWFAFALVVFVNCLFYAAVVVLIISRR